LSWLPTANLFFAMLAVATNIFVVAVLLAWLAARLSPAAATRVGELRGQLAGSALALAALIAWVATLGSLYYSEVVGFEPCRYCWFQRIAMYPLAPLLTVAAVVRDRHVWRYGAPLVVVGTGIAGWHYTVQRIPELLSTECSVTAPCTATLVWQFGFISIPYMALSGFLAIGVLLAIARPPRRERT
jgi:hypothetical protein